MADSVATPTVVKDWGDSVYHVLGTVAISGTPAVYVANGIVMNMNQNNIHASTPPIQVKVWGISGYLYAFIPGTTNANGLLRIFAQTASASEDDPLGQLTATTMPAAVVSDTIQFEAIYYGQQ